MPKTFGSVAELLIEEEREKFERGRRHLAQIMGEDPENFTQDKIDEAISYLFPSGLFSHKARPKFKSPDEIFPKQKEIQYDSDGRPFHDKFYTRQPNFFTLMNEAVYELEGIKHEEDLAVHNKTWNASKFPRPVLIGSDWFTKPQLESFISESITDDNYTQWLLIMNRIVAHPFAHLASDFIFRYRIKQTFSLNEIKYPEPEVDPTTGRRFIKAFGQKKLSFAHATVYMPGSGEIQINEKRLLEMFPELSNREQIMYPLHLTQTLGRVDIVATVEGEGSSSNANAIRTAISRCMASLLPEDQGLRPLLVSGLLTQDDRFAERKKPGQKKARKKPIWKAR